MPTNLPRFSTDAFMSRMVRVYLVEALDEPGGLDTPPPSPPPGVWIVWLLCLRMVGSRATKDVLCLKLDDARLRRGGWEQKG